MRHLLKCTACQRYTMHAQCICLGKTITPKPAKYSPEDKYASYRRKAKKEMSA